MKVTVQISCPGCFTTWQKPQYPFNMRQGGTQNWNGFRKEENLLPLPTATTDLTQYYRTISLTHVLVCDLNLISEREHTILVDLLFPENI